MDVCCYNLFFTKDYMQGINLGSSQANEGTRIKKHGHKEMHMQNKSMVLMICSLGFRIGLLKAQLKIG